MLLPTWIFDLDNTLHDANPHVFPHINRAMTSYLMAALSIGEAQANALRVHYWHRYGATLSGMMRHHGTDPSHFLWQTHQFDDLAALLVADTRLDALLARLAGRKLLFTNGPLHYAEAVLKALDIRHRFDGIIAIHHTGYRPKPEPHGFRQLLRRYRLNPAHCIMVEDTLVNLRTAKRLGMRTVWLSPRKARPAGVDWRIGNLHELARLPGLAHIPD